MTAPQWTNSGCARGLKFEQLEELSGGEDLDVPITAQPLQVFVTGHQEARAAGDSGGEHQIVFLVFGDTAHGH